METYEDQEMEKWQEGEEPGNEMDLSWEMLTAQALAELFPSPRDESLPPGPPSPDLPIPEEFRKMYENT